MYSGAERFHRGYFGDDARSAGVGVFLVNRMWPWTSRSDDGVNSTPSSSSATANRRSSRGSPSGSKSGSKKGAEREAQGGGQHEHALLAHAVREAGEVSRACRSFAGTSSVLRSGPPCAHIDDQPSGLISSACSKHRAARRSFRRVPSAPTKPDWGIPGRAAVDGVVLRPFVVTSRQDQ
jgi:hypothetical protein